MRLRGLPAGKLSIFLVLLRASFNHFFQYWNYDRYAADPINSPLFNGNASSMGGNGAPSDYAGVPTPGFEPPLDIIPNAGGGGCVTEGPFKEYTQVPSYLQS